MSGPVALVYGEALMKHYLSDEHPLQPVRVKLAVDLIKSTGLIEHSHLLPPRPATIGELELVHSGEYVELVRMLSDPAQRQGVSPEAIDAAGFASADNPISDELHEGTSLVVGASLVAAEAIGRVCFAGEIDLQYVDAAVRRWQGPERRMEGGGSLTRWPALCALG